MIRFFLFLLSITCFLTSPAHSWWDMGHMAVAQIAYDHLDPQVKNRVNYLIKLWENEQPRSSTFVTSACFSDDIKIEGNRAFDSWHGSALIYDPQNLLSPRQYDDHNETLKGKDAIFALEKCVQTLSDPKASDWNKALMLRMCIHIVADLHQPLHTATLFDSRFPYPKGDIAGTRFPITWDVIGGKATLHNLWDSACGLGAESLERPFTIESETVLNKFVDEILTQLPLFDQSTIESMNFFKWRSESHHLAKEFAYKGIKPYATPSNEYIIEGQRVCKEQIVKAALRLAYLLNSVKP